MAGALKPLSKGYGLREIPRAKGPARYKEVGAPKRFAPLSQGIRGTPRDLLPREIKGQRLKANL